LAQAQPESPCPTKMPSGNMKLLCLATLAAVLLGHSNAASARSSSSVAANPIRRVVTMLQGMQKKISDESKRDEKLFEEFMCYCKSGGGELSATIDAAKTKIPQLESSLEEGTGMKKQLETDLKQHKIDRDEAKEAVEKATQIREKEAAEYAKFSGDAKTNLAAMGKAVTALEKGSGSFLQTSSAAVLRRLTVEMEMSSLDRDVLSSFLSQGQGYAPQSGSITGILKQMKDTMQKSLDDATAEEEKAIKDTAALVKAKEKEIAANQKAIESKTERVAELGVEIETLKEDLEDTTDSLSKDQAFLANLETTCETKKKEWGVLQKARADELVALAETIEILNNDDALELFKKTLPSPSLLQTKVTDKQLRKLALEALNRAQRSGVASKDPRMDLLMVALRGRKVNFDKVLAMMDEMVSLLKKEQTTDDDKKAYCESKLDETEDELKSLELAISDLEKAQADAKAMVETLTEEIGSLEKGIKDLDEEVADATATRKKENEEYKDTIAGDTAAMEVLKMAANRLNQFYNPKLYKPPPKEEISEEERIAQNMGGAVLVQVSAHETREAPPPPPESFGPYMKKGEESAGVMAMMDLLQQDLEKEMTELKVDEKDAQDDYEKLMADSSTKRSTDLKSVEEKESAKADLESEMQKMKLEHKTKLKEAYATTETLGDLHKECDWLLANFETRKKARSGEVEALTNAKAVLSGADFSLVQVGRNQMSRQ